MPVLADAITSAMTEKAKKRTNRICDTGTSCVSCLVIASDTAKTKVDTTNSRIPFRVRPEVWAVLFLVVVKKLSLVGTVELEEEPRIALGWWHT